MFCVHVEYTSSRFFVIVLLLNGKVLDGNE